MYGLNYQWGRPTPFRVVNSDKVEPFPHTTAQVTDPEDAVKDPTKLYGINTSNGDWLKESNNQLWGYKNDFTKIQKTIYDP